MKKVILAITGILFVATIVHAQTNGTIRQNTPWYVSGTTIKPVINTNTLTVPSLGGSGTKCIHVDDNGLFSTATDDCGTGVSGGGGTGGVFIYNLTKNLNYPATTSSDFLIGASATSSATAGKLEVQGNLISRDLITTGPWVDPRYYSSLSAAITAIGSSATTTVLISNTQNVTSNLTIPANIILKFIGSGNLNLSNGVTVTIKGIIEAPYTKIFSNATGGVATTSFSTNYLQDELKLTWWGPPTGYGGDAQPAFQSAIDAMREGQTLYIPFNQSYSIGNTILIDKKHGINIKGVFDGNRENVAGNGVTLLRWNGSSGGTMMYISNSSYVTIENLTFLMSGGANEAAVGIDDDITGHGGTNTNNRFIRNIFYQSSIAQNKGISISNTEVNNVEFMYLKENQFYGSSTLPVKQGYGIYLGQSANAHGHIFDTNDFHYLEHGVHADAGSFQTIGRNNFNHNTYDWYVRFITYPSNIEYANTEVSDAFLFVDANAVPLTVRNNRIGNTGTSTLIQFGTYAKYISVTDNKFDGAVGIPHVFDATLAANLQLIVGNNSYPTGMTDENIFYGFNRGSGTGNLRLFRYDSADLQASTGDFRAGVTSLKYTATSTTAASTFPYASTTMISATTASTTNLNLGIYGSTQCLQVNSSGVVSGAGASCGGGGTGGGTWATTTSTVSGQNVNYPLTTTDVVAIGNTATTTAPIWFDPNTSKSYFAGNVGIGRTNPTYPLYVQGVNGSIGSYYASSGYGGLYTKFDTSGYIKYTIGTDNSNPHFELKTAGGNILISPGSSGKVGVGTTSPWRKLSVVGESDLGNSALAGYFVATTSTASVFPYASTTALSATTLCISGSCRSTWPSGGGGTGLATSTDIADTEVIYGTSASDVGAEPAFTYNYITDTLTAPSLNISGLSNGGLAVNGSGSVYTYSTSTWKFASSTLLTDSNTFSGHTSLGTASSSILTSDKLYITTGINDLADVLSIDPSNRTLNDGSAQQAINWTAGNAIQFPQYGTGIIKSNTGTLETAVNGTDFTLITGTTCSAGSHVSDITADGTVTCSSDTGVGGSASDKWATTSGSSLTPNGGPSIKVLLGASATTTNSQLEVFGTTTSKVFTATSTSYASTFPYASTTEVSATNIQLVGSGAFTDGLWIGNSNTGISAKTTGADLVILSSGNARLRTSGSSVQLAASPLGLSSTNNASSPDTYIYSEGANSLSQRNSTNSQTFSIFGTYTNSTNYEKLTVNPNSTSISFTSSALGTGTARPFSFSGANFGIGTSTPYAMLSVAGQVVGQYFTATSSTASTFPYASSTAISSTYASSTSIYTEGRRIRGTYDKSLPSVASSTVDLAYNKFSTASSTWVVWNPVNSGGATTWYCKTSNGTVTAAIGNGSATTTVIATTSGVEQTSSLTWNARDNVYLVLKDTSASSANSVSCTLTAYDQ